MYFSSIPAYCTHTLLVIMHHKSTLVGN